MRSRNYQHPGAEQPARPDAVKALATAVPAGPAAVTPASPRISTGRPARQVGDRSRLRELRRAPPADSVSPPEFATVHGAREHFLLAGRRSSRCAGTRVPTSTETPIERGSVTRCDGPRRQPRERIGFVERRRAVALARHYREFEGLSITQIAAPRPRRRRSRPTSTTRLMLTKDLRIALRATTLGLAVQHLR